MLSGLLDRLRAAGQFLSSRRIAAYLLLLCVIVAAFTIAFHELYPAWEGRPLSWTGSLLFVVETLSTTGYGDLLPFANETTALFATVMMATGVVLFFMAVPVILTPFIARVIRTTPPRRPPHALADHVVCAGYDDTVRALLDSLRIADVPAVVVVEDEEAARRAYARHRVGAHVVWGEIGTAAVQHAVCLDAARWVVAVGSERRAANTILAVRDRTRAGVIAIVDDPGVDRYLRYAGAEYVLSPKHMVGRLLARHGFVAVDVESVADATPADWVFGRTVREGHDLLLVKAPVGRGSPALDRTLDEIGFYPNYGVLPLILWRNGRFTVLPKGDAVVEASAMLFLLGRAGDVANAIEHELGMPGEDERRAVIAGFGDVGKAAYQELSGRGVECTVIDARDHEVPTLVGPAEDEGVLVRSGVASAQLLVAAVNDDSVNIFTTLMARNLNPDLEIVARANHPGAVDLLYRAGATFVALQPTVGGQVVAGIVLADRVRVLLDLPGGQRVVQRRWMRPYRRDVGWLEARSGAVVAGVEGEAGAVVRPRPDHILREGDSVMLLGGVNELRRCIRLM